MTNKIPEYIPEHQIERLISDIYYLKMEVNANYKDFSSQEIQRIIDLRLEKKKELYRLQKLKDRKNKILKIRSKI